VLAVLVTGSFATKEFQCWNFKQEDNIRNIYLNTVNNLRSDLANGNALNMGDNKRCPKGSNIYRLDWDCILENHAQKAVDQCKDNPTVPDKLSMNQTQEWWNVVKTVGLDDQATYKPELASFATLAHGKATRIGCAQKNCNGKLHMACMVYPKAATSGNIYKVGDPCTDCKTYEGSTCATAKGLCKAGYPGNTTDTPPGEDTSSTVTTTTGTTTTATTTTKKPDSTFCKGQESMSTDKARATFLDGQNKLRRAVANGKVPMGKGGTTRPCAKMMKLNYSCEYEAEAFKLAQECKEPDQRTYRNVNFFISSKTNKNEAADESLASWYGEITKPGAGLDQATGAGNLLKPTLNIDHFARMVWAENVRVGCAFNTCNKQLYAVCMYDKGVGVYGNPIYKPGAASCRQCTTACDDGLCTA
ncbi:SCP-like protein, partial [Ancylostoma ceylanicum]